MRELLTVTKSLNEMYRLVDGIRQKVLTENRRKMESDGIVEREVFPDVPPRGEYSLTYLGDSLRPIINSMSDWGTDYIKNNLLEQK